MIVTQLTFSLPLHLPKCIGWYHADLASSVGQPFSAAHFPGHCFGPITAPGSFAAPQILAWASAGKWTGLAPDDSPLVLRDTSVEEVYALNWEALK
ncbi:MAG TPA: hypothetical protein VFN20_14735 [Candidatus Acidoferrum sp.]|nr:hypothetical protein [Candidatus Acidoferrum sp.]